MAKTKVVICPYCGDTQSAGDRCKACGGFFEPLSRQASHNAMGPFFIRDGTRPFQPGASYETIIRLIERKLIDKYTILRGPTTKQFWTVARRVPGVAHLLGYCHNCDASVDPGDHGCHACGVPFGAYLDRNFLGLPDVRPLPWEASSIDQAQEPASSRTFEFRRAAEPLGISSFATDEELRGAGVSPMPVPAPVAYGAPTESFGGATSQGSAMAPQPMSGTYPSRAAQTQVATLPQHQTATEVEESPAASGTVARSMQRRLTEQNQTIRLLIGGMIVMSILIIVTLAALIASKRGDEMPNSQPQTPANVTKPPERTGGSSISGARPADDQSKAQSTVRPTNATQASGSAAKESASPVVASATLLDAELQSNYKHAQELIAEAEKTDRAAADRIKDYEAALALLKGVESKAPNAAKPRRLSDLIKKTEHELERLKLQEFFP